MQTKPLRDSNLELFRIIVMLLIVAHHYAVHSGLFSIGGHSVVTMGEPLLQQGLNFRTFFYLFIGAWGKIGINCFLLITGYFMCTSQITWRKFLKLMLEIYFYKISFYLYFLFTGRTTFTSLPLYEVLMPNPNITTNFLNSYTAFWLCIPFLNILLKGMTQRQHQLLLLLCLYIYVFIAHLDFVSMNYVSWFIVLYFMSSYARLYPNEFFNRSRNWMLLTLLCVALSMASIIYGFNQNTPYWYIMDCNAPLAVATSFCAFMWFKNIKIKYNKAINTIAATTFGIYLIHDNSIQMQIILWHNKLHVSQFFHSDHYVLYSIAAIIGVFVVCSLVDYLRIIFLEKYFFAWYDKKFGKNQ